jgi:cell volume regulation protein A
LFLSWAGIRGAASIVFVFLALAHGVPLQSDLFSLVLIVALISIALQGTLFPAVARRLDLVDAEGDYTLSFNDFQQQSASSFFKLDIPAGHPFAHRAISTLALDANTLIVLIKRGDKTMQPRGDTVIEPGDVLVVSGEPYEGEAGSEISQRYVEPNDDWANKLVRELTLPPNTLIVSIVREDDTAVTPKGWIRILPHDTITLFTW